jgi:hypothetical protein
MKRHIMQFLLPSLLSASALFAAQRKQTFTGAITDDVCPKADHSQMKMGANDAECTVACIEAHGASYVLYDGKTAYNLSDQRTPQRFAGKKVTVTGALDARTNTIQVDSINEAN